MDTPRGLGLDMHVAGAREQLRVTSNRLLAPTAMLVIVALAQLVRPTGVIVDLERQCARARRAERAQQQGTAAVRAESLHGLASDIGCFASISRCSSANFTSTFSSSS